MQEKKEYFDGKNKMNVVIIINNSIYFLDNAQLLLKKIRSRHGIYML
jgi:hypothetical protein